MNFAAPERTRTRPNPAVKRMVTGRQRDPSGMLSLPASVAVGRDQRPHVKGAYLRNQVSRFRFCQPAVSKRPGPSTSA